MDKLQQQKKDVARYLAQRCRPDKDFAVGLCVEHFITDCDMDPVGYDTLQQILRALQQSQDESILLDGQYIGYRNAEYGMALGAGGQLQISISPGNDTLAIMKKYTECYKTLCAVLAPLKLRDFCVGYHPCKKTGKIEVLPLWRYKAAENYYKNFGGRGMNVFRASATTKVTVGYSNEQDFVHKYRVACLLAPLLALLTDNVAVYEGTINRCFGTRIHIYCDAAPDGCATPAILEDENFGFEAYAQFVLQQPAIAVKRAGKIVPVATQDATTAYEKHLTEREIEQILETPYLDAKAARTIEICVADSMPPRYAAAYVQLIKGIFSSPSALAGIERHYAGMKAADVEAAKLGVCCNGYAAQVYGRPISGEIVWLLAQAKSRTRTANERCMLEPFVTLATNKKTIWETEHYIN